MASRMYETPPSPPGLLNIPQLRPMRLTAAAVRRIVADFDARGGTFHSQGASTLQVVLDHCHATGRAYRISGDPRVGYAVEMLKEPPTDEFQADPDPASAVLAMIRRGQCFEAVYLPGRGTRVEERDASVADPTGEPIASPRAP